VAHNNLVRGSSRSCGCLSRDQARINAAYQPRVASGRRRGEFVAQEEAIA
jgi:hypothetical protein